MKSTKTIAVSLTLLLLTVCMVIGLSACNLFSTTSVCNHQWVEATCTTPKTCSLCKATEGDALGHTGGNATCSQKAICTVCNEEYGESGIHSFTENVVKSEALKSAATCSSAAVYYKSCSCGLVSTNAADTFMSGRIGRHQYGSGTVCTICGFDAGDLYYYNFAESFTTIEGGSIVIKDFVYDIETNDTTPSGLQKVTSVNIAELELFVQDGELGGNAHGKICVTFFEAITKYYELTATISDNFVYLSVKDEGSQDMILRYSVDELISQYLENVMSRDEEKNREMLSFVGGVIFPAIEILAENSQSDLNMFLESTLNIIFTFEKQADGSVVAQLNKDKILLLNNTLAENSIAEVIDIYYGEGTFNALVDFAYEILDLKVSEIPEFVEKNDLDYDDFIAKLQDLTHKLGNPEKGEEGYLDIDAEIKNSEYSDSIIADLVFPSLPEDCDNYKEALEDYGLTKLRNDSLYTLCGLSADSRTQINDTIEELFNYFTISMGTNAAGEFTNLSGKVNKLPYGGSRNSNGAETIYYDYFLSFSLEVTAGGSISTSFESLVEEFNKESAPMQESDKEALEFDIDVNTYGSMSIYFQDEYYNCDTFYKIYITKADVSAPIGEQITKDCSNWNQYSPLFNAERYSCYVYVANTQGVYFVEVSGDICLRAQLIRTASGFTVNYEDGETKNWIVAIDETPIEEQLALLVPEIFADYDDSYKYETTVDAYFYYNPQTKEYGTESQHNWSYSYEKYGEKCEDGFKCTQTCSKCNVTTVDFGYYHDYEYVEIDLSEYGLCGGEIRTSECRVCGQGNIYVDNSYICSWEPQEMDADGFFVYKCSKCNAIKKNKYVTSEKDENCQYTDTTYYIFAIDGKEIFNDSSVSVYTSHNYEYTYTMLGTTCDDGYTRTTTCKDCNYTYTDSWTQYGHSTSMYSINLDAFGLCGGWVNEHRCQVCNTTTEISYISDYTCNWTKQYDDADGYSIYKCNWCNTIKKEKSTTTEKDENCNYESTTEYIYIVGGKVVYSGIERDTYYNSHDSEYTYELFGATCEDGYKVTEVCKDCGYTNSWTNNYHYSDWNYIYLMELGMCGGYIEEYRCNVCDTVTNFYSYTDCYWEWQYDGADGYSVYKCNWCNAIKKEKSTTSEKDENCNCTETHEYIFIVNGKEVYKGQQTYSWSSHNYKYSYEMFGETCYDGYKITYSCTDCDYNDYDISYNHNTQWNTFYLGNLGMCGGYIEEGRCQACDTVTQLDYAFDCYDLTWLYVDADGYSVFKCNDCGAILMTKSDKTGEYIIIQKGGKEIYNGSHIY